jgi:hypothetical protein
VNQVIQVVFDDKLENKWYDMSWCKVNKASTTKHSGSYGIQANCNPGQGFFVATPSYITISANTALQFWINSGSNNNIPLRLVINGNDSPHGKCYY